MTNRLAPLTEPYPEDIAAILDRYPKVDGYTLSLFRTFANSRRFLEKGVANFLDRDSPLTLRQREIVILRTCANLRCEYEWGVHVTVFAEAAGFTDAHVASTTSVIVDRDPWDDDDAKLLAVVDGICGGGAPGAELRHWFEGAFSREAQLEVLALVGNYHTISYVAKMAELLPELFAARFPG